MREFIINEEKIKYLHSVLQEFKYKHVALAVQVLGSLPLHEEKPQKPEVK